jgi:hypothetical protein
MDRLESWTIDVRIDVHPCSLAETKKEEYAASTMVGNLTSMVNVLKCPMCQFTKNLRKKFMPELTEQPREMV